MPICNGYWVPEMSAKQADIYNCYKRSTLVSGPKKSGKTLGLCHKVLRHAWEVPARVGVYGRTAKVMKDGGAWTDLYEHVLPQWLDADMGMRLIRPAFMDSQSRQLMFHVSNARGTKSTIVLNSLDHDDHIDDLKGRRYSMIWFNELSNFKKRKVFDVSSDQLRWHGVSHEQHQWIGDTNPADEGEDSWIYKLFYIDRLREDHPDPLIQKQLGLIEIMIPDNPYLTEMDRRTLYNLFAHDPDLYNRYIMGKWVRASIEGHFQGVFNWDRHVVGNCDPLNPDEWETLLPQSDCVEMCAGWDIGSKNHAIVFVEPAQIDGRIVYKVLDEMVILDEVIGLEEIVGSAREKMVNIESEAGRTLEWRHHSDKSAFDMFSPLSKSYQCNFIYQASQGEIELRSAPKYQGSLRDGVNLMRKLFHEDRLLISKHCTHTIEMIQGLRRGNRELHFVDPKSPHKHIWDALRYVLMQEEPWELLHSIHARQGQAAARPRLVAMAL